MKECPTEILKAFPKRNLSLNKYTAGTVTIVGGSRCYNNAPVMTAIGARSGGAGLIHLVVPDASRISAGAHIPEATFLKLTPVCVPPKADVFAVGMGLGTTETPELLVSRLLSGRTGRFVLDADALNVLAKWYASKPALPVFEGLTLVLTPHAGEAARLLATTTEEVEANREEAIKKLVERYRAVVVLKGPGTLVAAPGISEIYKCEAGNPFMALGGMGDLLSGMIAARWAYLSHCENDEDEIKLAYKAACSSVWLHASASDSLIEANPPVDPTVINVAHAVSSMRVALER